MYISAQHITTFHVVYVRLRMFLKEVATSCTVDVDVQCNYKLLVCEERVLVRLH